MRKVSLAALAVAALAPLASAPAQTGDAAGADRFHPVDVFGLEYAADPQISPDGRSIVYVRSSMDVMTDGTRTALWILGYDGSEHRPLVTTETRPRSPRWSPDGRRLAYIATTDDRAQIFVRWLDTGQTARITDVTEQPANLAWSPDGHWLAFTMFVPSASPVVEVELPEKPEGAEWARPMKVIDELEYRADGRGYLEEGHTHVFVVPAEGGSARQLTRGPYDHGAPAWLGAGRTLVLSANREDDRETDPLDSEIYALSVDDGSIRPLTDRQGPDGSPTVSPDGSRIAYLGFDDRLQGYQVTRLYVMDADGGNVRELSGDLDRDVDSPTWSADGRGIFFQYDDEGDTRIAWVPAGGGEIRTVAEDVGGLSLGRPYGGSAFSVGAEGRVSYTAVGPQHPADVGVARLGGEGGRRLTRLNDDLLAHKELGAVEEIWYESSHDGRRIQGWIIKPPGFDAGRRYPLILEIHGGPFANYGPRFAAELQLMATAGYVVLYTNPRGSTSYGEEFGNLIHHAYPSQDYDDLISGVDAVIDLGYADPEQLFVTGGSGGGVLSAWIVGHTDRFRAAVIQKPVINWYSFVLTADNPGFFYKYWFPGPPWEHLEHYMARSPLSYVGNVTTPTMLITGEVDYRTPISETEQFYQALRIRGVPTAMVRVPDASHGIANRPSYLIGKVAHIVAWFDKWRTTEREAVRATSP